MSEKEDVLERIVIFEDPTKKRKGSLHANKKSTKNTWLYKRFKIKPKRVLTYLLYFVLSFLFMLLPIFFIMLLKGMGL
ncbi:MAG: hypothetical protein ACFFB0_15805 [Promethearchaeota archaeon]